jgi:hypothetical protein
MKCKVRQLKLKPLLEKSTLSNSQKVQNCQVQVQKLQMQTMGNSMAKKKPLGKVQLFQTYQCC